MRNSELSGVLSSFIFPKNSHCLCCGDMTEPSRIHGICDLCASKIEWRFTNPFEKSGEDFFFDDLWPCCVYGAYPRRIISGLKLGSKPYSAEPIGLLLSERLEIEDVRDAVIVPVPMYIEKQKQRGFNQAGLLAETVSKILGLPIYPDALVKTRPTKSMRFSSGEERRSLQNDVFGPGRSAEKLRKTHVILVDDVVTTGSTADACAKVLKDCGAARVSVLCFAATSGCKKLDTDGIDDVE